MSHPADAIDDPIERIVAEGLTQAGIRWEHGAPHHLDFYLPDFGTYIEVKQFHTERAIRQLAAPKAANTILIQGRQAAVAFASLITATRGRSVESGSAYVARSTTSAET